MAKKGARVLSFTLTAVILILLIYFLRDIDFVKIYILMGKANFWLFGLAVLCGFGTFLLWNLRWKKNLSGMINISFWHLFIFFIGGQFFTTITPGRSVGGEFVKAYFLSKEYNKSKTKILGTVIADKFFYVSSMVLLTLFSIIFMLICFNLSRGLRISLEIILAVLLILVAIVLIIIFKRKKINLAGFFKFLYRIPFLRGKFSSRKKYEENVTRKVDEFGKVFSGIIYNKKQLYSGFLISFAYWLLNFLVSYFIFLSFGYNINFLCIVSVFTMGYFIGDLVPVPGGIGFTEGTMFLLYSAAGISGELALLVILLTSFIYYFFSLFVGGLAWIYLRWKYNWSR